MIPNNRSEQVMRRFKTKPLFALLVSALAGTASAVNLGNDSTGQVLIYPYYTVRTAGPGDWSTYLNVVNHTPDTKALRLRFREGKNGRSVFDMNLYLGAGDVWAGALSKTADGTQISSSDKSCITAAGSFSQSVAAGTLSPAFSNALYVGSSTTQGIFDGYDGEDTSLDRTREGFFEIIEMGVVTSPAIVNGLKHDSAGTPANCGVIANISSSTVDAPRGGISGGASLIHVMKGSDFGFEPVVLEDFYRPTKAGDNLWTAPGNRIPDLSQATPVSRVMYLHKSETAGTPDGIVTDVLETQWDRGVDAVSAVLMHDTVKNTYVLDEVTRSSTDWIVTLPTKQHYVSAKARGSSISNDPNGQQRLAPFTDFFWKNGTGNIVYFETWDRNEQSFVRSLCSLACDYFWLPWQSNVGTFIDQAGIVADEATLLGSKDRIQSRWYVDSPGPHPSEVRTLPGVKNGWASLIFTDSRNLAAPTSLSGNAQTYYGMPVVGFMVQDFVNTSVNINGLPSASSYGGNFNHKYTRKITGGTVTP